MQAHSAAVLPRGGLSPSVFLNTLNCPSNVVLISELHIVYAPSHEMLCKTLYDSVLLTIIVKKTGASKLHLPSACDVRHE